MGLYRRVLSGREGRWKGMEGAGEGRVTGRKKVAGRRKGGGQVTARGGRLQGGGRVAGCREGCREEGGLQRGGMVAEKRYIPYRVQVGLQERGGLQAGGRVSERREI